MVSVTGSVTWISHGSSVIARTRIQGGNGMKSTNYFGFKDNSKLCAHTYCEVDYFRKYPEDARPQQMKS